MLKFVLWCPVYWCIPAVSLSLFLVLVPTDTVCCLYHQEGIKPMWEDPQNRPGGKWVLVLQPNQRKSLNQQWMKTVRFPCYYPGGRMNFPLGGCC